MGLFRRSLSEIRGVNKEIDRATYGIRVMTNAAVKFGNTIEGVQTQVTPTVSTAPAGPVLYGAQGQLLPVSMGTGSGSGGGSGTFLPGGPLHPYGPGTPNIPSGVGGGIISRPPGYTPPWSSGSGTGMPPAPPPGGASVYSPSGGPLPSNPPPGGMAARPGTAPFTPQVNSQTPTYPAPTSPPRGWMGTTGIGGAGADWSWQWLYGRGWVWGPPNFNERSMTSGGGTATPGGGGPRPMQYPHTAFIGGTPDPFSTPSAGLPKTTGGSVPTTDSAGPPQIALQRDMARSLRNIEASLRGDGGAGARRDNRV